MSRRAATPDGAVLAAPRRWEVRIPGFRPSSLNRLLRLHWAARGARLRREAAVVALACRAAGVPPATGRRRVSLRFVLAGRARPFDEDNAKKGLMDALVKAKVLVDDGPAHVEHGPLVQERGGRLETVITIEEMEG